MIGYRVVMNSCLLIPDIVVHLLCKLLGNSYLLSEGEET